MAKNDGPSQLPPLPERPERAEAPDRAERPMRSRFAPDPQRTVTREADGRPIASEPGSRMDTRTDASPRNDPRLHALEHASRDEVILVRSRTGRDFKRAGLSFGTTWTKHPIETLSKEQAARIVSDPSLEVHVMSDEQADAYLSGPKMEAATMVSIAELQSALNTERARAIAAEDRVRDLESRLSGSDKPPRPGEMPPGTPPRLPEH